MAWESWKAVTGYEGAYEVSDLGKVRSLDRVDCAGRRLKGKILKLSLNPHGYPTVMLCKDFLKFRYSVHRLVALAFIDNPYNLPLINHKDEIKTNNHVENLEWCTAKYNINYGSAILRRSANEGFKSSRKNACAIASAASARKSARLVIQYDLNKEVNQIHQSIRGAARSTGIPSSNIILCCHGKYKTAGGFIWGYAKEADKSVDSTSEQG